MAVLTHTYDLSSRDRVGVTDYVAMVEIILNDDGSFDKRRKYQDDIDTDGSLSLTVPDGTYLVEHGRIQAYVPDPWDEPVYVIVSGSADLLTLTAYRTVEALRLAVERASADARYVPRSLGGTRVAFLGDSMENNGQSYLYYLAALGGGRVSVALNAGVGGNTTVQMLARVGDVIARAPDVCVVGGATNDHSQGVPQATTQANVQAIVAALVAAGIAPVVRLTPPCDAAGTSSPWNTVQLRRDQIRRWNTWLASWASAQGIPVLDFYTPLVDPATGGYRSGFTSDNTHPTEQGFHDAAEFMIESGLPTAFRENGALLEASKNDPTSLWEPTYGSNGVFIGDANSDGRADGWNGLGTGTPSLVAGTLPVLGNWQRITNPSSDYSFYQDSITPAYQVGDIIALSGRFRTNGSVRFRARLAPNNSNETLDFGPLGIAIADGYFYLEQKITSAGATRARAFLTGLTGTGYAEVAQVQFQNLTANGIV